MATATAAKWVGWISILAVVATLVVAAIAASDARASAPLVVSLTFDDSYADQIQAHDILAARGLHGTFYAISGLLGHSGRLTIAQLQALQSAGEEIGGHTIDHPHLTTLSTDQQRYEICDDRETLMGAGLRVTDLAYPYGDYSAGTELLAAQCGYNSARAVSGLDCSGCALAETTPPMDAYATRAYPTNSTTTVAQMESQIQAAMGTGGWDTLVFHHVCDPTANCGPDTVTPGDLTTLADWLVAEQNAGALRVARVADVIGGSLKPAVHAPLPGPATLVDPALSSGTGSLPDCWSRGGYGQNTATVTRITDAQTGQPAVQLDMSAWTSGDVKLLSVWDTGTCSPAIQAGATYTLTANYHSVSGPELVAFYETAAGGWQYLAKSAPLPASSVYGNASWTTPPLPAGAIRISVGMLLGQVGSATVDSFDLARANPPNLLSNGSLETDANGDGVPDCILLTSYGQNTGTYTRTTDAHTGTWAETFTVDSVVSGDRKVLSAFTPGCAPAASTGHPYLASLWYKSTAPVRLLVYYRSATTGAWLFWVKSPALPAASTWTQATLRTPPAPPDAAALSIGLALGTVGNASVDDLMLGDIALVGT
jgi:peptidoglycan/xylan/chitin deacetylase (PgdA/CDA1 family)